MFQLFRPTLILLVASLVLGPVSAWAFWVWTPQKGKFENPGNTEKETAVQQMEWALGLYESKEYDKAISEFKKIPKNFPRSEEAADAVYYIGVCQEELGKYYEAYQSYQTALERYARTGRVQEMVERQFRIANLFYKSEKKKLVGVTIPILPRVAHKRALEIYRAVIENAPFGPYAATARFHSGRILFEDGKWTQALVEFETILDEFPSSEHTEEAQFYVALTMFTLSDQGDYDPDKVGAALEKLEEFVQRYPESNERPAVDEMIVELTEKLAEERFRIAAFYEKQNYPTSAQLYYSEVVKSFPGTSWAEEAQGKLDRMAGNQLKEIP